MLYAKTLKLHHLRDLGRRLASWHLDTSTSAEIQAYGSVEATREVVEDNFSSTNKFVDSVQTSKQFEQTRDFQLKFLNEQTKHFRKSQSEARYGNTSAICIRIKSASFRTRLYYLTALNLIRNSAALTSFTMLRSC